MEVLSSRVLLRSRDPERARAFYRDVLGLAVYREFPGGTVFFLGHGFLEVSGRSDSAPTEAVQLWLQVRDLRAAADRLAAHVVRPARREPWGLDELWVEDPDGVRIVLVEVPPEHPLRRDARD
ncbi:VOC family protein [Saccharothrix australiensis]|uniref:Putative enzyme related to lactoylglutathione lyase n=1 Tax=Saccharothrix australiensis TaxID=2072 RepID=A0A495VUV6_9PSEU|nr:VOC family protein [Saccharothrix australiensis]RKT53132.1 putative enzyme related to lactoylglutathione lyase [Saccharothrix australiensis]